MADNESNERFEELRQRWEQDPSSRIFTQLAEEYRRRGENLAAAKVLEEGLEHHPGSIAAQVSLGRCRLDAGLVEPALAVLEAVVRKDPTQMVAYRLLVEAYLQQGDAEAARERLEIYSQLNSQDPEVEALEERIRRLESAIPQAPPSVEARPAVAAAPPATPPTATPPAAPSVAEQAPAALAAERGAGGRSSPPSDRSAIKDPAGGRSLLSLPPSPHPPPNLFALVPRPLRWWRAALDSGEAAVAVGPDRDQARRAEADPAPEGSAISASSAGADPSRMTLDAFAGLDVDDQIGVEGLATEAWGEPAPAVEPLPAAAGPVSETTEQTPMARQPESAAPEAAADADPGATTVRLDVGQLRRRLESEDAGSVGAGAPGETAGSQSHDDTLTLAELYRRQGHTRDAEQIFRRVLDADPDNPIAQSGLEQITAQRRGPADISSLLGEAAKPEAGVTERKAAVLRNYLELLSDGSRDDVS
jgi:tetratricopeptide (TPR) repeat protein